MPILAIGLNHTTAPLELREQLALNETRIRDLQWHPFVESVLLSTCNRTELYTVCDQIDFEMLENYLADATGVPTSVFAPHLYQLTDTEAARHLLRVAAGLDSLVLGEAQILGQVSKALSLARELGHTGPLLSRLFQAAIHSGKRVHNETAISRTPASVASLAASIAKNTVADLAEACVAILGAGEMAELTVEALRNYGAQRIVMINRTLERVQAVAERWSTGAAPLEMLAENIGETDVLITSTSADSLIVHGEMIHDIMQTRPNRPLLLIDIAVPRNIDPAAAEVTNVSLYDIDHLNTRLEQAHMARLAEAPRAEAIVAEETNKFIDYLHSLHILPVIADLHQQAESIRQTELAKTLRHLPNLNDDEREHLEALTRALVNKLLAPPTQRLRIEANCPQGHHYAEVTRTLFNLPGQHGPCSFLGATCPVKPTVHQP